MDVFSGEPILSLRNVTHRYSGREILKAINLTIHRENRLGLLGVNGAGKSTLLRLLAGQERPDEGERSQIRGLRIGFLSQELFLDPEKTIREGVEEGLTEIRSILARYEELGTRIAESDAPECAEWMAEHARLQAEIDHRDAWNLDREVELIMQHLRVPDPASPLGNLSGGELRRVAICRTLVSRPDLLILDEPTNHLDSETIEWLEQYLAEYRGTVVLVTHDRYFLDRVADRMIELDWGALTEYVGNYSEYLELKAERMAAEAKSEHVRQMTIRREYQWIKKQPKARSTKQQARVERFQDLVEQGPPQVRDELELVIPTGPRLGGKVVNLKGVSKRYDERPLIERFDFEFSPKQRIGVIGPNGVGKTTLMRILLGEENPDEGTVDVGVNTQFVYAPQGRDLIDREKTVVEEIAGESQWVTIEDQKISVWGYLKRFLFTDEQANTPIKRLSGGEQNRVQLAKLLRKGGNVLIFDEPTNDLDLPTLRVLEEALLGFSGCALIVSHDRYFLNRVATGILAFEGDGRLFYSEGSYDRYLDSRKKRLEPIAKAERPDKSEKAEVREALKPLDKKVKKKLSFLEARELEGIEERIAVAEGEVTRLEAQLQDPSLYAERGDEVPGFVAALVEAKHQVEVLYERWQALEALKG